ncbi:MAG: M3 family oligoendopeptidase [Chthonomonadales bacterium]|nr:M3 family oligoendopeptidase [Chthonomonadales bacterium]
MSASQPLPRWDMTPIFPSLDSPEFRAAFESAVGDIGRLAERFDRLGVRRRASAGVDSEFVAAYEQATHALNELMDRLRTVGAYVACFVTTDARDEQAQSLESELNARAVLLDQLRTRYTAWVGTTDTDALLEASEVARHHAFAVRKAAILATHQMPEAEENLAAELAPTAIIGWARLHGTMTSLLTADVEIRGETQTLPMSSVRALASDPDRTVRQAAFEAEIKAWESVEVPIAACMNGVKGYQSIIRRRRSYDDDVAPTLLSNSISADILDAMQRACAESFPDFRRYMAAKARALGVERLAWYDLMAPVGASARRWDWPDATEFILTNFGRYSERLQAFARRAFDERWVDAEPRVGKEGGAYCTGLLPGVSRVFMNFDGSFTSVSTLAHELGHAYHNLNLAERTPIQRLTPSTLAETASIFCETLSFDAALQEASADERIALLDTSLERDLQTVVDIHSRFLFEKAVFERRKSRDLTVAELKQLMTDAQRQTYGPDVEPLHPYMWAVKGHYYGPTFYNYPYTFGLLFGIGLYARYLDDPNGFRARYDEFLSSTGMDDAASLGMRFGADVTDIGFWRAGLDVVRTHIAEFERLTGTAG